MADNLLAVRTAEHHRGPTLVWAHNGHLQRHPTRWHQPGLDLEWWGAGATIAALLGERYAFVAGALVASEPVGLKAPPAGTFEAALPEACGGLGMVPGAAARRLLDGAEEREDVVPAQGHFPLDAELVAGADGLLVVTSSSAADEALTVDELAARALALPGADQQVADEASGAPEISWGDRFFFVGGQRQRPFATIVGRDVPGFDEASHLDRPGVVRLNAELGRQRFAEAFGFPPARLPDHLDDFDFTQPDVVLPHPAYGTHGWACIVAPTAHGLADVERLLAHAHRRATARHRPD